MCFQGRRSRRAPETPRLVAYFEPQFHHRDKCRVCVTVLVVEGFIMSSLQQRTASTLEMRLAALAAVAAGLKAQLSELEGLREQVRKAQLSAGADLSPRRS
jgi:hypothetical protein